MIFLDNSSPNIKSPIRTVTNSAEYGIIKSSSKGESCAYKRVEAKINNPHDDHTQIEYVLKSTTIAELELRGEKLRDLLLESNTALSEKEIFVLKRIFSSSEQFLIEWYNDAQLMLVSLASILEPLIENEAYSQDISFIVRCLLKSSSSSLRYAGLDIIASGLGIVSVADSLLLEAKILLKQENSEYVRDYLESL